MRLNIDKIFKNKSVAIIGGGSSLIGFDFSRVKGSVVAVNNSCYSLESDVLVALDKNFYERNKAFLDSYTGFMVTDRKVGRKDVAKIEYDSASDWTMRKVNLSGFTAISVAFYLGASKVSLLGFDGGFDGLRANHYESKSNASDYARNNKYYAFYKDYPIINYGLGSKIETFKKKDLTKY